MAAILLQSTYMWGSRIRNDEVSFKLTRASRLSQFRPAIAFVAIALVMTARTLRPRNSSSHIDHDTLCGAGVT